MNLKESIAAIKFENNPVSGIRTLEDHRPLQAAKPDLNDLAARCRFIRVQGIGSFWDDSKPEKVFGVLQQRMQAFLVGMAASCREMMYVIQVVDKELAIYLGSPSVEVLKRLVTAQIPGCQMVEIPVGTDIFGDNRFLSGYSALVGSPAPSLSPSENFELPVEKMDQFIRGMGNLKKWSLVVMAQPFTRVDSRQFIQKWGDLSRQARLNFQQPDTPTMQDRLGEHYVDLLENQFQRAMEGQSLGSWQVQVYVIDNDGDAAAIAESAFCDVKSRPEVVRAMETDISAWSWDAAYSTWLNSRELSFWMQLPIFEYPGYQVQSYARFDVALPADAPKSGINLGWIQDVSYPSGQALFADPDELTGHILVAGTTNSGKTNTTFHLLDELNVLGKSFLVIEPTKGEYRFLKKKYPGLRLYTMGSPEAPLKINPFYVPAGVPVQMHLDYLLSLFSASFVLYAPMPYVLESALHEVYADRGWDLINDVCIRNLDAQGGSERNPRSFPTLTDLLFKVEEVTEKLGYDDKISADVKAALHARINSLRVGNKGTMLDTQIPFDFKELMSTPTIIEMGSIGDDEQKAFLIGLLLTRLFEQNIGSGIQVGKSKLRHVTVIEEAHRLLQNAQSGGGSDFANPRGKAVETFCNLITEIRAYGEGFVIVEQSPVKLAPDVVKNTNFKIIHRIISADDRQALAQVMNLDEKMQQIMVGMTKGNAVVFAGGMDRPMKVRFVDKKKEVSVVTPKESSPMPPTTPAHLIPSAARLAEEYRVRLEFSRWFLSVTTMGNLASDENWGRLRSVLASAFPQALKDQKFEQVIVASVIPSLATWLASSLGRLYLWPFTVEEQMEKNIQDLWNLKATPRNVQETFFHETTVGMAPFPGCRLCSEKCHYRFFVNMALQDQGERNDLGRAIQKYIKQPALEGKQDITDSLKYQCDRLLDVDSPSNQNLKICFFAQTSDCIGLRGLALEKMVENLEP